LIYFASESNTRSLILDCFAGSIFFKILTHIDAVHFADVEDHSDGLCDGGAKLVITVVSDNFISIPTLQRHRIIQNLLKEHNFMQYIHALTLNTWTIEQFENKKQNI
jgi:stress-induced morphogen